jgi:small subunit ribosomal protein S7
MAKKYKKPVAFSLPSTTDKVEKFINFIMKDGKKNVARKIFFDCMEEIKKNGHVNPLLVWEQAIDNASPNMMIKAKRI